MQADIRTGSENASSANQMHMMAGISALLSGVFLLLGIAFSNWENPSTTNTMITILTVLGYTALLPVAFALYRHLRTASQGTSAIATVAGLLGLAGVTLGTIVGFETELGMPSGIFSTFGMLVWLGLVGYLSLQHRLLTSAWSILSIVVGLAAVTAGTISMTTGSESAASNLGWAVFSILFIGWCIWTGLELIRRGRGKSNAYEV
jgi:FtsH-binding integral membrane protein